jgi:hypothetical protein
MSDREPSPTALEFGESARRLARLFGRPLTARLALGSLTLSDSTVFPE